MQREIGAMPILKAPKWWYCVNAKSSSRNFAELGTSARGAIVGEADEALIEGSVPQCRKQKAVVDQLQPVFVVWPERRFRRCSGLSSFSYFS